MNLVKQLRHAMARWLMARFKVPRDAVRWACRVHANRIALITLKGRVTFRELHDRSLRLAQAMRDAGLKPGKVLLYQAHSGQELIEIRFAAYECGAVAVGLPDFADTEAARQLLSLMKPLVVIAGQGLALATLRLPEDTTRVLTGAAYEAWLQRYPARWINDPIDPDAAALLGMTSGTTGAPKLMATTHGAQVRSLQMLVGNLDLSGPAADGPCMPAISLSGAGSGMIFPALLTGSALVVPPSAHVSVLVDWIERHRVTRLFVTPSQLIDLLELTPAQRGRLSGLQQIIYGTESMPVPKLVESIQCFGPIVQQGYGSAEVLPPVALFSATEHARALEARNTHRLASSGRVVPEVGVKIVGDAGQDMPLGEPGRVMVNSPTRFAGYWGTSGLQRVGDGEWLAMGDWGRLDADGFLYILGRETDVLRVTYDGVMHQVYPRQIEDVAHRHPAVREASAVQADKDGRIWLVLSLRNAARAQRSASEWAQEVHSHLRANLPIHAWPRHVAVVDALPRSPLGKVLRRKVREEVNAGRLLPAGVSGVVAEADGVVAMGGPQSLHALLS